ncbi:hypothetical protein [Dictyoglomus thermophilum]|nr:hypothetical protein [Dictyoglomus thermophilum]
MFKIMARSFEVGFSEIFSIIFFCISFYFFLLELVLDSSWHFFLFMGEGANYLIEGTVSALQLISGVSFYPYLFPDFLKFLAFIFSLPYRGWKKINGLKISLFK